MGLRKGYGSPNGAMRRGWKGITISRDTIHIEGVKLGTFSWSELDGFEIIRIMIR